MLLQGTYTQIVRRFRMLFNSTMPIKNSWFFHISSLFFLLVVIFSGTFYIVSTVLNKTPNEVKSVVTEQIDRISKEAQLQSLAHLISYYDIVLTESARNYAFTGDLKWKQDYIASEPILQNYIEEALKTGTVEDQDLFAEINEANTILTALEYESFALVEAGNQEEAISSLASEEYLLQKEQYRSALEFFEDSHAQTFANSTLNATRYINESVAKTEASFAQQKNLFTLLVFTILSLFGITGTIVMSYQLSPIQKITNQAKMLTKGEWNKRLDLKEMGSFSGLANSLNEVARQVEQQTLGLQSELTSSQSKLSSTKSQLLQEQEVFEQVFKYSSIGMALVSKEGAFLEVNKSLLTMLGYTEEELKTKSFQDITHPDDLNQDLEYVQEMLDGKRQTYTMKKRYIKKDGSILPIRLTVSMALTAENQPSFFISQIQDLSEPS